MTNTRERSGIWRLYQLLLLAVAAASATYARSAIGPLQEAMRKSLVLSDNQTALLQGMALALPMGLAAIPLGLLADRTSRKRIILICLALAFASCVLSALATNFHQLLAARFLTGLSVPGLLPIYSMASDLCVPATRGRATMIVGIGEISGAPVAFALGGALLVRAGSLSHVGYHLGGLEDWNEALLWMAAALVPVLLLVALLREPQRSERVIENAPVREALSHLWRYRRVAVPLQLARAMIFIADGAVFVWGAPLFSRKFHMPADRIGATLGLVLLVSGLVGPALGGPLVDWCQRHGGPYRAMRILAVLACLSALVGLFALLPSATGTSMLLGVFLTLGCTIGAVALALTLIVIPGELRGLNLGLGLVISSVCLIGLAPLVVSGLSSALGGEAAIGQALAIVCGTGSLLAAIVFAFSARYFPSAAGEP